MYLIVDKVLSLHSMSEYLFKIGNALQAAKGEGDGSGINLRLLARNLSDCNKHMEEAVTRGIPDEPRVRQRAVLAALISCPRVREVMAKQPALAPLLKTVPVMQDCTLSMIVRPLSCQSAVLPVLVHLPLHLLSYLIKMELERITKAVSPPLLSLLVELSKALLHVLKSNKGTDETEKVFGLFRPVFRIALQNFDSNVSKNAAFTFLLLLESLFQFSRFILNDKLAELPTSYVPELQNSFPKRELENVNNGNTSVMDTTISLLKICQESVHKIDVNTWISWAEVEPTDVVFCSRITRSDTQNELTVQSLISYRAFSFLNLFDSKSIKVSLDETLPISEKARKDLWSALMEQPELHGFLKQIASDPDYDPDSELGFTEVVSSLQSVTCETEPITGFLQNNDQTSTRTKERLQKLTKLLLQEPDSELLFNSSAAADVVSRLVQSLSVQQAGQLLQRYLQHAAGGNAPPNWNKTMVAVCQPLPGTVVRYAVMAELQRDGGDGCCRDWLTTGDYYPNLTSLSNTMAHDQETNDHSLLADGGLWWVSVQRPRSTVSALVQQAVSVSGMALVTARAVRQLAPLCTARYANGKLSILSEALEPFITDMQTFSKPKYRIAFIEFFGSLCEHQHSSSPGKEEEEVVLVEEVMRELLLPTLQWQGPADLDLLEVPLALLQVMLQQRGEEVVRCCQPGADTASLLLTLLSLVHNCHCLLAAPSFSSPHRATTDPPANEEGLPPTCDERSNVGGECSSPGAANSSVSCNSPSPSPEVFSTPGSSQCLAMLCRSRNVLRRLVKEISNTGDHRQSALLLRRYLNGSCLALPVSCVDLLHPLLVDRIETACSESNSSETIPPASCTRPSLEKVCGSRAAALLQLMSSVVSTSPVSENFVGQLREAEGWPYEQWVITLLQVLHSAPQEDWIAASGVLEKINLKSPSVSDAPVPALAVLRDVLQLVTHVAETGLPLNTALCYKHCIAAATHVVKQRCSGAPSWRERLSLVTRVFLWWCTDHVAAQDTDLPCLLLLRLADMVREIAVVVVDSSDQPRTALADLKTTATKNTNSKELLRDSTVSCEELLETRNCGYGNGNTDGTKNEYAQIRNSDVNTKQNIQGLDKKDAKGQLCHPVSLIELRAMVGSLVEPFLKYSTEGKLSQTIATRLSALLEC